MEDLTPESLAARVTKRTDEIAASEAEQQARTKRNRDEAWHNASVREALGKARESEMEALFTETAITNNEQVRRKLAMEANRFQREEEWLKTIDLAHNHVTYCEEITEAGVLSLTQHLRRWARLNPNGAELDLELNSPGGEIIAGLHLIDSLESLRRQHKLTITVRGEACSMAGVVLQAAGDRVIGKHAYIMLHRASFGAAGTADEVEDSIERTKMYESTIYNILAERSGRSVASWKATLGKRKDVWWTAQDAIKYGLADRIG